MKHGIGRYSLIEGIFWGSFLIVLIPLVSLYVLERRLQDQIFYEGLGDNWELYSDAHQLIDKNLTIPNDLRHHEKAKNFHRWIYKKKISRGILTKFNEPNLVLGRIGDSDRVTLNNCVVGSTGLNRTGEPIGWWWGVLRSYPIPKRCLGDGSNSDLLTLEIEVVQKGIANFGIYAGPIGLGDVQEIGSKVAFIDFFRFDIFVVFGLLLIAIGIYYLFVFFLVPERFYNGVFAIFSLSTGVFEIMVSSIPYQLYLNTSFPMKLNFISAVVGSFTFIWFIYARLRVFSQKIVYTTILGSLPFLAWALVQTSFVKVYDAYKLWFPFFILMLSIAYGFFLRNWIRRKQREVWRYFLGCTVFMGCCIYDVVISLKLTNSPYLIPYGFVFLLTTAALALAKEYADAFLHVESQVKERTQDLASALDQLRSLEKMKERFFANVSHDFKTPIAVALGTIEEVKGEDQKAVDALAPAERSLNQLLGMITDLLDTVKAESGTLKLNWQLAKPAEILSDWAEPFQALCKTKSLKFELDIEGCETLMVPMDVPKMRRVLDNLLSNAVKFTDRRLDSDRRNHPQGAVRLSIRTDEARLYIEVSDSGIGIPKEERKKIFDRYFQSSRTSLKEHGGSGIGLSFAKEMVDLQNGEIWVEDSDFGGSKFVVAMPLSQDVEITGEHQVATREKDKVLHGSLDVAYPKSRPEKVYENWPTVLVAEDNPEVAQIIHTALSHEFNVHFAPNGQEAYRRLQEETFNCLVTDIVMPIMRGDELVPKVRELPKTRGLPIIVLSSHGDEATMTKLLRSGANDYVTKPFRREILLARVKSQIQVQKTSSWISKNEKVIELGFLAGGMAHQIRNGLNSLQNQVSYQQKMAQDLLKDVQALPPEKALKLKNKLDQSKEIIARALDRIERLTDSVKTYSSGSKKRVELSIEDVTSLARTLHEDGIKKKGIQIHIKGVKELKITGYASFHEAVVNLLGNAIGACSDDGTGVIEVIGTDYGKEIEISIRDNGQGISPEVLPQLCQPFYTTKDPGEGTGLGLYIVRDVVEAQHGGELHIFSSGLGQGSTFTIRVPKMAPAASRDADVHIHGVHVS